MPTFQAIIKDGDQFDKVFQEGLKESEGIDKDFILGAN